MNVIYFLIPISLIFLVFAVFAFRFAIKSNQFDDLDKEAERIILDDRIEQRSKNNL